MEAYALRDILPGEEITISYVGQHYTETQRTSAQERRSMLQVTAPWCVSRHLSLTLVFAAQLLQGFHCTCASCEKDAPVPSLEDYRRFEEQVCR